MRIQFGIVFSAWVLPFAASAAIDISTGRQLFVDDFLVEVTTNVVRHWNRPIKMDGPIVWPGSGAAPKKTDTSFLGNGEWKVEIFRDAGDAPADTQKFVHETKTIKAGDKIPVHMAPGGGLVARLMNHE